MQITLFLMSAVFIAWLGFVVGMMIRGVDPTLAGAGVVWVFVPPLLVLPIFNFSPSIQIHLVMAPASRYFVYAMFIGSSALLSLWAIGKLDATYPYVFFSIWLQIVLLRFLVRRYFKIMGIYPGEVVFSEVGGWNNNRKLPMKNRLYATVLLIIGVAQLTALMSFL